MEADKEPGEKDVYHLPKHLKKAGELLLIAASEERRLFRAATVGGHVVEDFYDEFILSAYRRIADMSAEEYLFSLKDVFVEKAHPKVVIENTHQ